MSGIGHLVLLFLWNNHILGSQSEIYEIGQPWGFAQDSDFNTKGNLAWCSLVTAAVHLKVRFYVY